MTDVSAEHDAERKKTLRARVLHELKEWGATLAIFIPIYLIFTTFAFELRSIPSESMVPNLQVGDRVAVNKFAYGYSRQSVPFGLGRFLPLGDGRIMGRVPDRGDVVVFQHPHFNRVMIKRVIGVPGDTIQMRGERLYLNGEQVSQDFVTRRTYVPHGKRDPKQARVFDEALPGGPSYRIEHLYKGAPSDDTPTFIVPEGHIFMMGDNRDDSYDSRALTGHCPDVDDVIDKAGCTPLVKPEDASVGFVPLDLIIGRADTVFFTLNFCRDRIDNECPPGRVWRGL